jgi:hypothetical protein
MDLKELWLKRLWWNGSEIIVVEEIMVESIPKKYG